MVHRETVEYNPDKRVAKISYATTPFTVPITSIRLKAQKVQKAQVPGCGT